MSEFKSVLTALAALSMISTGSASAQSFNGAGPMAPGSPTGWSRNPNGFIGVGSPYPAATMPYGYGFGNVGMPTAMGTLNGRSVVYPFGVPNIMPVPIGGGAFNFTGGGLTATMWGAPSGYYYPWCGRNPVYSQIIYVDQSGSTPQTVAQQPPLSMQFTDMNQFLDDALKNKKVSDNDYKSLKLRLKDIQSKERSYRIQGGGSLTSDIEGEIRQNLTDFAREMTNRVQS